MHPFTIVYTERWARTELRDMWAKRHAEPEEPDWSSRLAQVHFRLRGALDLLREANKNKAWWDKAKRTPRERAIEEASANDLGRYFQLTGLRIGGVLDAQPMDAIAFRALERKDDDAMKALDILKAITQEQGDELEDTL